jgi:hypothetical protein
LPASTIGLAVSDLKEQSNMNEPKKLNQQSESDIITVARARWLEASDRASQLAAELFQPGSGYGDPDARVADEHRLQSARLGVERLFREYNDLDRRDIESKLLDLQRSQRLATWASFAAAAVVGLATVVSILVALFK